MYKKVVISTNKQRNTTILGDGSLHPTGNTPQLHLRKPLTKTPTEPLHTDTHEKRHVAEVSLVVIRMRVIFLYLGIKFTLAQSRSACEMRAGDNIWRRS